MAFYHIDPNETDADALGVYVFFVGADDADTCPWCLDDPTGHRTHVGWSYAPAYFGGMYEGDPSGPFPTEAEALTDARNCAALNALEEEK